MKAVLVGIVLAAVSLHAVSAQRQSAAETLIARAHHKATVDGDLRGAISDYRKAVAAAGKDRRLAARALLRLAECHAKLGDAEAGGIFTRIIRDYPDQTNIVTVARASLEPRASATAPRGDRPVWTARDADGFGGVTPDGRYMTYTAWSDGAHLGLRDLSTGTSYRLTPPGGSTQFSAISRDGRWVAYEWIDAEHAKTAWRYELRVARLAGTALADSRRLVSGEDIAVISPHDWSPDGKTIVCEVIRTDQTRQLALVSVGDGTLQVLKSLEWRKATKIFFSPDGRYIGYDRVVADDADDRHVFVLAVDRSAETAIAPGPGQNVMMGWSPDGRHLLFSSDRSGSVGLWAVPVRAGVATGAPFVVKPDISSAWSLGLTPGGTMYVWAGASPTYVQTSSVDLTRGTVATEAPSFHRFITSRGRPSWSLDGTKLAYQTCNPLGGGPCTLWIHDMHAGSTREVKPKLGYFFFAQWSPEGRELLTSGIDMKGRNQGAYRIDVQTGEARRVPGTRLRSTPQWAPQGTHLYHLRDAAILRRDMATGQDEEVTTFPVAPVGMAVSPDGTQVAYTVGANDRATELFVRPLTGGTPRSLLRAPDGEELHWRFQWTSAGRAVAIAKYGKERSAPQIWIIDVATGNARQLDVDARQWNVGDGLEFDRAGTQVAFVGSAGEPGQQIRALENFLPRRSAAAVAPRR